MEANDKKKKNNESRTALEPETKAGQRTKEDKENDAKIPPQKKRTRLKVFHCYERNTRRRNQRIGPCSPVSAMPRTSVSEICHVSKVPNLAGVKCNSHVFRKFNKVLDTISNLRLIFNEFYLNRLSKRKSCGYNL